MGRKNERGLELTFHRASKRWRKVLGGKLYHFGYGNGVSDKASYQAALARYKAWKQEREGQRLETERGAVPDSLEGMTWSEVDGAYKAWGDSLTNRQHTTRTGTFGALLDAFMEVNEKRYKGRQYVEQQRDEGVDIRESKRQNMSAGSLGKYRFYVKAFREQLGNEPWDKSEQTAAGIAKRWRQESEALLMSGKQKATTFNSGIASLRRVFGWAHEQYLLASIPREKALFAKYTYKTTAKAVDLDTIKTIWAAADDRLKACIALALNAGFYAIDCSDLRRAEIVNGYIVRERGKTGVLCRHKLWAVTATLIERTKNGNGDGRVWVGKTGKPLVWTDNKSLSRSDAIKKDLIRLCPKLGIPNVSFSNFRDTAATFVEGIMPELTDTFLSHTDKRVARFYVDQNNQKNFPLDRAIDALEKHFNLTLDK